MFRLNSSSGTGECARRWPWGPLNRLQFIGSWQRHHPLPTTHHWRPHGGAENEKMCVYARSLAAFSLDCCSLLLAFFFFFAFFCNAPKRHTTPKIYTKATPGNDVLFLFLGSFGDSLLTSGDNFVTAKNTRKRGHTQKILEYLNASGNGNNMQRCVLPKNRERPSEKKTSTRPMNPIRTKHKAGENKKEYLNTWVK